MASEIGEAPASGLGKLLQDERFLVPTHQRDYSWSVDEVALLLDDVEAAYDRGDKQYFIGLMVFMGADGPEQLVLDGQQRLATAVINFPPSGIGWGSTANLATTPEESMNGLLAGRN